VLRSARMRNGQQRARRRSTTRVTRRLLAQVVPLLLISTAAAAKPPRFPRWPTELHRTAAPLYSRGAESVAGDRLRVEAVLALDAFATPVIEDALLWALDDPSVQVRREALRLCFERGVTACIDGAATLYNDGVEPSLRIAALKVLGLDAKPRSVSILIAALRDSSDVIRAQSAELLGTAPLDATMRKKARAALLAKLPDVSAVVRRSAVHGLGRLGPGDGALAIARVLDDPEPTVRAAAALALRRMRDPRVVPALRRAVASPSEPLVSKALVEALAVLETNDREEELLALVDDPPPGLNARQVADALARRSTPGPALIAGLIDRLREPALADACLQALLVLGESARPGIEAAIAGGVEAPIEIELLRLVAALAPVAEPAARAQPTWPAAADASAWLDRMRGPGRQRRADTAAKLAELGPAWLGPALGAELADAVSPGPARPWLLALGASPTITLGDAHTMAVARLTGWARDVTLPLSDRCLSLVALGTLAAGEDGRDARRAVDNALSDRRAEIRACGAAIAPRAGLTVERLEAMLVDPDPGPRAIAALATATFGSEALPRSVETRLAVMRVRDPNGHVRQAAQIASDRALQGPHPAGPGLLQAERTRGWALGAGWVEYQGDPEAARALQAVPLWLPTFGPRHDRWVLVPGEPEPVAMSSKYALSTDIGR